LATNHSQVVSAAIGVASADIGVPSLVQIGDTDVASLHQPPLAAVRWEFAKVGAAV